MRCPIHVDDISEVFVQVLMADAPRHNVYNSGGEAISLGALADLVREFIPEAQITFENETGGKETSSNYLIDNSRLMAEFEVEYAPFRQRVMEIINDIRRDEGMPLVQG
jgi:nucleoside-diphosphate-sugar epimerase